MKIGIVIVGKNEAKNLHYCFMALEQFKGPVVYVDSASTDNSVEIAKNYGAKVVELMPGSLLSAAIGRNAGFKCLLENNPEVLLVQFIDGDTALIDGWLETAEEVFSQNQEIAILAGELYEKDSDLNLLKMLSRLEWQKTPGETRAVGGNMMARASCFKEVNGFDGSLKAGEEAEFCLKLRQKGWKILQLKTPMAMHNSGVLHLKEFVKRSIRTGYAFAEVSSLPHNQERVYFKEVVSDLFYALFIPLLTIFLSFFIYPYNFLLLLIYPLLFLKIYMSVNPLWSKKEAFFYSLSCTLGKFTECFGALKYYLYASSDQRR